MQVQAIESMPFAENSYLLRLPGRTDCVVIDPGLEPELILEAMDVQRLTLAAILCTHGHADHIGGNEALKRAFPQAPLLIGEVDAPMLTDAFLNLSALFGVPIVSPAAERTLREGDVVELAGIQLEVLETPGHSPGHIAYLDRQGGRLFSGDVLFAGSVGRTDFPGCSFEQLRKTIQEKLFKLPDETEVFPGHGPITTIGEEKRSNPFVGQ